MTMTLSLILPRSDSKKGTRFEEEFDGERSVFGISSLHRTREFQLNGLDADLVSDVPDFESRFFRVTDHLVQGGVDFHVQDARLVTWKGINKQVIHIWIFFPVR